MADNVEITSGTPAIDYMIGTKDNAGVHDQVVQDRRASTEADDFWTVDTTGVGSRVAADSTRLGVLLSSKANGRVLIRFDGTIPALNESDCHTWIEPGERWELPSNKASLAISFRGVVAGGTMAIHKVTP